MHSHMSIDHAHIAVSHFCHTTQLDQPVLNLVMFCYVYSIFEIIYYVQSIVLWKFLKVFFLNSHNQSVKII